MQTSPAWQLGHGKRLQLDEPRIVAILNITPDSFFEASRHSEPAAVVGAATDALRAGASMLDIGGESTRPGAQRVSADEQIARIVPAIAAIRAVGGALAEVPISVDTTLAPVASAAIEAGADAINDIAAGLDDADVLAVAAQHRAGVILMHRLRPPEEDSYSDRYAQGPRYEDVVAEVRAFLAARAEAALEAGVAHQCIVVDPGLGFGKTVEQNLELVRRTPELASLGYPVLSAASRKSFVGRAMGLAGSSPSERLAGSIAFSIAHYHAGVRLFRVHDVAPHLHAVRAAEAIGASKVG